MEVPQTSTAMTIKVIQHLFATHGLPEQIVSDSGPQLASAGFAEFAQVNGNWHTWISPYYPASNGEAQRFVSTFKEAMEAGKGDGLTLQHQLENFLLTYCTTPHSTAGAPPCELLMVGVFVHGGTFWNQTLSKELASNNLDRKNTVTSTPVHELSVWDSQWWWRISALSSRKNHPVTGTTHILGGCGKWSILEAPSRPFERLCSKASSRSTPHWTRKWNRRWQLTECWIWFSAISTCGDSVWCSVHNCYNCWGYLHNSASDCTDSMVSCQKWQTSG